MIPFKKLLQTYPLYASLIEQARLRFKQTHSNANIKRTTHRSKK